MNWRFRSIKDVFKASFQVFAVKLRIRATVELSSEKLFFVKMALTNLLFQRISVLISRFLLFVDLIGFKVDLFHLLAESYPVLIKALK